MRILDAVSSVLWGRHVLLLLLLTGVIFTVKSKGYQLRRAGSWLRSAGGTRDSRRSLTTALAGSLGTGNIVGVAAAITAGGAGAIFWMWVSAIFGMMTVFAENFLSAKARERKPNTHATGALRYIELVSPMLALLYAAGCGLSSLCMGNMAQTNACTSALESLHISPIFSAIACAVLAFLAAQGGLQRAKSWTEKLVPAMTILFFTAALGVLWVFRANLPSAVHSIFTEAFSLKASAGGGMGMLTAMRVGLSRGIFTNEAGLGSSAFAYEELPDCTAEELGHMGIFQVFLDTLVMCTVTGLCILCCRSPMLTGAQLTIFAFESAWGVLGGRVIAVCTALFAIATVISWSCYGWQGLSYLTHGRGKALYAILAAGCAFVGCLLPVSEVLQLGDAMNGLLAIPNCLALLCFAMSNGSSAQFGRNC